MEKKKKEEGRNCPPFIKKGEALRPLSRARKKEERGEKEYTLLKKN